MNTVESNPQYLYQQSHAAYQRGDLVEAIAFGDQLLETTKQAPQACAWAARLRLSTRSFRESLSLAQTGLNQNPSAELFGILGQAHEGLGEYDLADRAFMEACKMQPDYAPWIYHRALGLLRLQRDFEAMELLRRGSEISPNAKCLFRLAELELAFGDPSASAIAAEKALELDPTDAIGQTIAASSLTNLGLVDEADKSWHRAISLSQPDTEQVELIRARFYLQRGDFDRGLTCLDAIIKQFPDRPSAYAHLSANKDFSDKDLFLIEQMTRLSNQGSLSNPDRILLEFAIGKACDDLGRYEKAMQHFDRANRLAFTAIERRGGFDREEFTSTLEIRKEIFSRQKVEKLRQFGTQSDLPIFVMGMMRSGTTLVERILASHPMVSAAGEQTMWINCDRRLIDFKSRRLNDFLLHETSGLYLRLLSRYAKGAKHVVDKQPGNLILAGALHIAFPKARIIYMRRSPVDNALSIWNTHIRTDTSFVNDKGNIAFALKQYEGLLDHWRSVIPADRFLEIPYESLILDRENTTRELIEFCGLPWDDACLSPERETSVIATPSVWQARQAVYRTSVDRWRNYEPWLGEFRQLMSSDPTD